MLRVCFASIIMLCCATVCFAQKSRYAPFTVDSAAVTASLKVKDSPLEDRFADVFRKHKLNAASPDDWQGLLDEIAGIKETDLWISKEVSMETTDDSVDLVAIHFDSLEQMVKSLRLVIATPEKLDAFLTDFEKSAKKK